MKIYAVDLSINSTGIFNGETFFNVYTKHPKKTIDLYSSFITFIQLPEPYTGTDEVLKTERIANVANVIFDTIKDADLVLFEGFAFTAKSNRLAEIAGLHYILRSKLLEAKIPFKVYTPLTIKKAAGKGNYDKNQMIDAFLAQVDLNINEKKKPLDDIADAYWLYHTGAIHHQV